MIYQCLFWNKQTNIQKCTNPSWFYLPPVIIGIICQDYSISRSTERERNTLANCITSQLLKITFGINSGLKLFLFWNSVTALWYITRLEWTCTCLVESFWEPDLNCRKLLLGEWLYRQMYVQCNPNKSEENNNTAIINKGPGQTV